MSILQGVKKVRMDMQKYNDFAMPNLENIEQMARAYKDFEINQKSIRDNECDNLNKDLASKLFKRAFKLNAIAEFLHKNDKKNHKYKEIYEASQKFKLDVDGLFAEYELRLPKEFSFSSESGLQDMCLLGLEFIQICLRHNSLQEVIDLAYQMSCILQLALRY